MNPPEIIGHFVQQLRLICGKLCLKQHAAFKCTIAQDTRTEAVNGKDRRLVEVLSRQLQASLRLRAVDNFAHDRLDKGQVSRASVQDLERVANHGTNASTQ